VDVTDRLFRVPFLYESEPLLFSEEVAPFLSELVRPTETFRHLQFQTLTRPMGDGFLTGGLPVFPTIRPKPVEFLISVKDVNRFPAVLGVGAGKLIVPLL